VFGSPNSSRSNDRAPREGSFPRALSWESLVTAVGDRFDRGYRRQEIELPPEIRELSIYAPWSAGKLTQKITSPFWDLARPQKNQSCLDLGCGLSFLIYPWREWGAYFYGQEISQVARDVLMSRGPQLNSKLFKGVRLAPAHELNYPTQRFDLVVATGWSCYFPPDYWNECVRAVKRVLKPGGHFVFDLLDPDRPLVEDWALLETYLGAEVFLEPLVERERVLDTEGAGIVGRATGEFHELYKVRF
jgi:SAM-dependent methyltransferase